MTDEPDLGPFTDSMDGAMVIVTATDPTTGERSGCLVGFACQCSIQPPQFAVWLSRANRTRTIAERASHLAVHLVPDDARGRELAEWFGGTTGDDVDTFGPVAAGSGPGGVPLIDDLPWRLVGEVVARLDLGDGPDGADHIAHVLRPTSVECPDADAELFRLRAAEAIDPGHPAS